ncbi:MAG: DUF481 domain-containing protein [Colwellia sp.]|nr:DUF481 domain-containing protein [Colwellia sp.]MCW8866251.1 DUF481 domain-containing protein [Colwellia sp.]MCW9082794.1 DUF481 domain-containing protein [Colwellia sp.]
MRRKISLLNNDVLRNSCAVNALRPTLFNMLKLFLLFSIVISLVHSDFLFAKQMPKWVKPTPVFSQKFDWLKLTSDEWLKGDIISMYDDELEFDSDEFGIKSFDWEDVAELRSRFDQKIRLADGRIVQGFLVVKEGRLTLISGGTEQHFPLSDLLTITSAADSRKDLWDAKISLGIDLSQGNSNQRDYFVTAEAQRRTPVSRLNADFIFNYSESSNENTTNVTVNTRKFNSYFDWFYSAEIFFRVVDYENYKDLQQNIKERHSLGSSLGYHVMGTKRIEWDVTLGPSYQITQYHSQAQESSDEGVALSFSTLFEYQISSRIDYTLDYQMQFVNEDSGARVHHFKTGFEFEFIEDLDIDLFFYLDRVAKPVAAISVETPEPNDYRLVLSIGYQF